MYGLLGRNLSHSLSPEIHSYFGDYQYRLFCREPDELDAFFADESIDAFNVTIPYKKEAYKRCDVLDETAEKIGCVNTVVRRNGKLYGYNTDLFGFKYAVCGAGADFKGKKVIVLGSGGASLTVQAASGELGAREIVVISRSGDNNYENLYRHYDAEIIVNTTPVGMYPNNGKAAIDLKNYKSIEFVFDLIYNPYMTALLLDAEKLGIPYINGLTMLAAQGLRSAEFFFDRKLDEGLIDKTVKGLHGNMLNIVLIGMPGCGKTTVGRLLSQMTGREAEDTDELVVKADGRTIPKIFADDGEESFRQKESAAITECGKRLGLIIATGGGAVMRECNCDALRQNGVIIYLRRSLEELETNGRPLSEDCTALKKIYKSRREIYESFADYTIDVDRDAQITAERVIKCVFSS